MLQIENGRTITNCIECGNNVAVWDDDPRPLCEYCEHFEMCEPPEKIIFYNSTITGEVRAECLDCRYVNIAWLCNCELEHDCKKH